MKKTLILSLILAFGGAFMTQAALITNFSNNDGAVTTVIDGDTTGDEADSAATANPTYTVTSQAILNSFLSANQTHSYVVTNWGTGYTDGSNTLQNVGAFSTQLDVTLNETRSGSGFVSGTASRSATGTNGLSLDIADNTTITIDFSYAIRGTGFVINNLGAAYDASDATNPGFLTANFWTGVGGTGTLLSSQDWRAGNATDANVGDNANADAYFGFLSSTTDIRSVTVNFQRDGNTGNGGVGLDDLAVTVVPEPSTYAMLAAGLTGLVLLRRRRAP